MQEYRELVPEIEQTYMIRISRETSKHQDLVLHQLLRHIPEWFNQLTPTEIANVLNSEAEHLLVSYPVDTYQRGLDLAEKIRPTLDRDNNR